MLLACKYCASTKIHRSHRYGTDYIASALFGYLPYRCSKCGRRFRLKQTENTEGETPVSAETAVNGTAAEHTKAQRRQPRMMPPSKRKTKRQFLREILVYALALAAFLEFLKWLSEDHSAPPPPN